MLLFHRRAFLSGPLRGAAPSDDQDGCNARTQKALILYRNRLLGPVRGRFRIIPPYLRLLPDGFGAQ